MREKILVIEDDPEIRDALFEILELKNYSIVYAENGRQGVELAIAHLPDLILCDVMMPELDGYGVLRQLQDSRQTETIPFIFLTGCSTKDDRYQGMQLGADDYLTKPFTATEVLTAITTRLNKKAKIDRDREEKLNELRSSIRLYLPDEMRNPLNGILASAEFLQADFDLLDKDDVLELIANISISAKRLNRLIINFLLHADLDLIEKDAERLESLQKDRTEYPSLVIKEIGATLARKCEDPRSEDLEFNLKDATVRISRESLIKILEEVIDNALKFSQPGSSITIASETSGDRYHLTISDRGSGIAPDRIASIGTYQPLDRKEHGQSRAGLGLTLANKIVNLYGGSLEIESILNSHTAVRISLPTVPEFDDDNSQDTQAVG